MNTFEVEIKFRVKDTAKLERRLQKQFGTSEFGEQVTESDFFFQHPRRNFVKTDECLRLRIRTFSDGTSEHFLTYKGPKNDPLTKTRQEIELPITEPERWESLLAALSFHKSASVQKLRRRLELTVEKRRIEITLDTLLGLPESARTFLEIETIAVPEELDECRSLILKLAEQLGLSKPIRNSYLNLVQKHERQTKKPAKKPGGLRQPAHEGTING
jgi:adenylate cyclase class 2